MLTKRILLLHALLAISSLAFAQGAKNTQGASIFKVGTKISYALDFRGNNVEYNLSIKSIADSTLLDWDVPSYGTGTFVLSKKALQSGNTLNFEQVEPNSTTRLKDTETVVFISKDSFSALQKTGSFTSNSLVFSKKKESQPLVVQINGKTLDLIHVSSADGVMEMWILNHADFPLIAQIKGNPANVNFTLTSIKN